MSRVPVVARADTTARAPRDTVKSPIAVAPRPASPELDGRRVRWDRAAIFASTALTLPDLLAQVPGVTTYQASYIAAPTATSWYGESGRVRVFLDGVELDALDAREGGVRDLSVIQLWSLEEVTVERAAGELRVHLRSLRVQLTTAQTRTDVVTGSDNTNLYRGFFGKRLGNGAVMQVAAQQYSTTSARTAGDGDALSAFLRLGVARGRLTVDGVATRFGRTRSATRRNFLSGTLEMSAIGPFEGRDLSAYLRAAWGNPDSTAFWAQVVAATLLHGETGDTTLNADTTQSRSQYVATAGFGLGAARFSAGVRVRPVGGETRVAPELRASWESRWVALSARAEEGGPDSTRRVDLLLVGTPLPWLQFSAAHSIHTPDPASLSGPERSTSRATGAVRVQGRWLRAGLVQHGASRTLGMPVFDSEYQPLDVVASTGLEAGLSGQVWGPFSFDWRGIRWRETALYRPQAESRAEIRVRTSLEKYLTRRAFDLDAALIHDYRGSADFPDGAGSRRAQGAGTLGGTLDIRIGNAHIFWYNRNATGKVYETVPGYLMPRLVQVYGLRWEFWN